VFVSDRVSVGVGDEVSDVDPVLERDSVNDGVDECE